MEISETLGTYTSLCQVLMITIIKLIPYLLKLPTPHLMELTMDDHRTKESSCPRKGVIHDPITSSVLKKWKNWLKELKNMEEQGTTGGKLSRINISRMIPIEHQTT